MGSYLIQSYLDASASRLPEKAAVRCDGSTLTYRELQQASNRLARCLKESGVNRQDRVVFCLKRSPKCLVAIEGILKADAIYVPIDVKSPISRWRKIVDDCQPTAVICDLSSLENVVRVTGGRPVPRIIALGRRGAAAPSFDTKDVVFQQDVDACECSTPGYKNVDTDIAYILYTSGSTGIPKGVMVSHLNIANYIGWAVEYLPLTQSDAILSTAPFHFDMSTFDIHGAVRVGATLCIATESCMLFPKKLYDLIEGEGVTVWKAVSSLLLYLSATGTLKEGRIPTLRDILFAGEVLPTKHLRRWMETYPDKSFHNVYGPTEATGISTHFRIGQMPKDDAESIPIGTACANTEVFLLKDDDSPAQVGEIGELYIRGSGLSRGYWGDREKTARVFIENPMTKLPGDTVYKTGDLGRLRKDGTIEFVGRKDTQVKFMGYRIELSEIEAAMTGIVNVNDAAVILSDTADPGLKELVAYAVVENGCGGGDILSALSSSLPAYMLPRRVVILDRLPRTERGKVDRVLLAKYAAGCAQGSDPELDEG